MPLRENLVVIVAPWKFDVLKTSIFALEASLLGQIFVLRWYVPQNIPKILFTDGEESSIVSDCTRE